MTSYRPPLENVAIFDSVLFIDGDDFITQNQADSRYLRYPVAQGTETLQAINVNGDATFAGTSDIIQQSGSDILQQPASTATSFSGSGNALNRTFISTANGASATPTLQVNDNTQNRSMVFLPNSSASANNQIVQANDAVISSSVGPLTLTRTGQGSTIGLRLGNSLSLNLGAGGTSTTPTNNLNINGTTNTTTLTGTTLAINNTNVSFGSTTPPTSSQTIPASSDSSTKIPTTAWVQSAITAGTSTNITPNSIQITPTTALLTYTAGINNLYNMGAFYALSGSTTQLYTNTTSPAQYTPSGRAIQIRFTTADGTNNFNLTQPVTFTLNCFFYDGSSYGETSCQLMLFPAALTSNWGSFGATTYNINNNINGNTGFYSAGRQYWTSNQQLSGFSGSQGWLQGLNNANGVYTVYIYFTMWSGSTWTYWIRSQAVNGATTASPQLGIQIFS